MSSKDLAPMQVRREREERQEKVFKQSIVTEEPTIIAKTNKGETVLNLAKPEFQDVEPKNEDKHSEQAEWSFEENEAEKPAESKVKFGESDKTKRLVERLKLFDKPKLLQFFNDVKKEKGLQDLI